MTVAADGIAQILERLSALKPDEPAIIAGDHTTTWKILQWARLRASPAAFQARRNLTINRKWPSTCANGPHYLKQYSQPFKAGMIPVNVKLSV